jgi:hypothetical protein
VIGSTLSSPQTRFTPWLWRVAVLSLFLRAQPPVNFHLPLLLLLFALSLISSNKRVLLCVLRGVAPPTSPSRFPNGRPSVISQSLGIAACSSSFGSLKCFFSMRRANSEHNHEGSRMLQALARRDNMAIFINKRQCCPRNLKISTLRCFI